jgi:Tat protein translocase TatC
MASREAEQDKTRMTLGEHLDELRRRLFRGALAVVIAFFVAWGFRDPISAVALRPHFQNVEMLNEFWTAEAERTLAEDPTRQRSEFFGVDESGQEVLLGRIDDRLQQTGPSEGFFFQLKICLYFAVFLGAPVLLWQLWQFVAAGLYATERRAVTRYFPISVVLFVSGVLFGYFWLVPYAMFFLGKSVPLDFVVQHLKIVEYFGFLSSLSLSLGAVFQLPILMVVLARAGIVEPQLYSRYRGHFLVASFVIAAILTPPDPFTQVLMALPMCVLYEVGVWWSRAVVKRSASLAARQPGGVAP